MKLTLKQISGGWQWQAWGHAVVGGTFKLVLIDQGVAATKDQAIADFRFLYS